MSHFAKVEDGIVIQVIVAEQDFIDNHTDGTWIQTSYNTRGGKHYDPNTGEEDSGTPLNDDTCQWESPVAYPTDGKLYTWDEDTTSWKEITEE